MKEKSLDHLVYLLRRIKKNKEPKAIVLMGAGCSKTAGIPTAGEIMNDVLEKFSDHPDIKKIDRSNLEYAKVMECLGPRERNQLFKTYVEKAKINASHIYLAHLMAQDYIDYILTVNFDNLVQRALAFCNIFPPIYDISALKDLTTTSLDTESITYLHGTYNGLWQLNTREEMQRIHDNDTAKDIFTKITNGRLWIVIGYSGDDFIFEQLVKLGRFNNGLYWVGYKEHEPSQRVREMLLDVPNTESFWVKGYDADSFFMALNSELGNPEPLILNAPFAFLGELFSNIAEMKGGLLEGFAKLSAESKAKVEEAIRKDEMKESILPEQPSQGPKTTEVAKRKEGLVENEPHGQLHEALIQCINQGDYESLPKLEKEILDNQYEELYTVLSNVYNTWGLDLGEKARQQASPDFEMTIEEAFAKFARSIELDALKHEAYNNWGINLGRLAERKEGVEKEHIYQEAFKKYASAIEIEPNDAKYHYNWATQMSDMARMTTDDKVDELFELVVEKFERSIELDPYKEEAFYNLANCYGNWATRRTGAQAETLYEKSFQVFEKVCQLNPDKYDAYNNWGINLSRLAEKKTGVDARPLFEASFEKFNIALQINPQMASAYYNWGTFLGRFAKMQVLKEAEPLYHLAFEKFEMAIEINPHQDDVYYNWGTYLGNLAGLKVSTNAEPLYRLAFEKFRKAVDINPQHGNAYYNWGNFLKYVAFMKQGTEAYNLLKEAIEKYRSAIGIQPNDAYAWNNWGTILGYMAEMNLGEEEPELLYQEAFNKFKRALKIQPKLYDAFNSLANFMVSRAETKSEAEMLSIYQEAEQIYNKAIELNPDYFDAYYNYGTLLGKMARQASGERQKTLYQTAFKLFEKAETLYAGHSDLYYNWGNFMLDIVKNEENLDMNSPTVRSALEKLEKGVELGGSAYNLACFYALQNNADKAFKYLEDALSKKDIGFAFIDKDPDWDLLRTHEKYIELKERYAL
ncbi:MAG: tetratricopeptide repeat protein [Bacteroidota bacterium]